MTENPKLRERPIQQRMLISDGCFNFRIFFVHNHVIYRHVDRSLLWKKINANIHGNVDEQF